jgi:hypothetical protein
MSFCGVIWNEEDKTRMEKNHHHNSKVVRKRLSILPFHSSLSSHTDELPEWNFFTIAAKTFSLLIFFLHMTMSF